MPDGLERARAALLALAALSVGLVVRTPLGAQTARPPEAEPSFGTAACAELAPEEAPADDAAGGASRLRLDVERHVRCLDLEPRRDLPHFEERVDVEGRTAEALVARFLAPDELVRGATPGGAPGPADMQEYRPGPTPGLNLLPVLKSLGSALSLATSEGSKPVTGAFFLYRVRTASGSWPLVRDGRLPPQSLAAAPGVRFELLGEYPDSRSALAAYRRLEAERGAAAAHVELPRPTPKP